MTKFKDVPSSTNKIADLFNSVYWQTRDFKTGQITAYSRYYLTEAEALEALEIVKGYKTAWAPYAMVADENGEPKEIRGRDNQRPLQGSRGW